MSEGKEVLVREIHYLPKFKISEERRRKVKSSEVVSVSPFDPESATDPVQKEYYKTLPKEKFIQVELSGGENIIVKGPINMFEE